MWDSEAGLQYLRARYYDPEIGRFLTRDSITGVIENPLSQNRYTYAWNNPVNYTDPSGHWPATLGGNSISSFIASTVGNSSNSYSTSAKCNQSLAVKPMVSGSSGQYTRLYDPAKEIAIENRLREEARNANNIFSKGLVAAKGFGHAVAKRYRYATANYQASAYNSMGIDPKISGNALDTSVFTIIGESIIGSIAKGLSGIRAAFSSKIASNGGGLANRGYKPNPGERTFEGFVKNNVPAGKELKLFTNSSGFNNVGSLGGQFKRFGTNSHAGLRPMFINL